MEPASAIFKRTVAPLRSCPRCGNTGEITEVIGCRSHKAVTGKVTCPECQKWRALADALEQLFEYVEWQGRINHGWLKT